MKITKTQLKQIIQEETEKLRKEGMFGDMFGSSKTKDDASAYDRKTKLDLLQQWKELVSQVKNAERDLGPMTGDLAHYLAAKVQKLGNNDWTMVGIDDIKKMHVINGEIDELTAMMHEWKPRAYWTKRR